MNDAHETTLLGAYSLGILDADEQRAVDEHLAECPRCRSELAELQATTGLLAAVPADMVSAGERAEDDLVLRRTLRAVRAERSAGRLRRLTSIAASIVVLAAVSAGVGVLVGRGSAPTKAPQQAAPAANIRRVTGADPATGARVDASVTPAKGWVRLSVKVEGVAQGQRCKLIAVSKTGVREVAGSWVVSEVGEAQGTDVAGAAAVPLDQLASLEVVTFDGDRLVAVQV